MQEKRKILYVITKGNFGGAQKYVYDLATNLPKDEFEPVVASGSSPQGRSALLSALGEKGIRTIEIDGLGREIKAQKDFKVLRSLIKIIKEERPHAIHLNSSKIGFLGSVAALWVKLITKNYRPKSIFTAHGWAFNERTRSSLSRFVYYLGHYATIIFCDLTIAVSEKARRDALRHFPLIQNKIKVVYNGIGDFKTLSKEEARGFLAGEQKEKTVIFSMSELHKNKGIDVALQGMAMLPQTVKEKIIYCVAGDGEEKESLLSFAKESGIEKIVKFLGFVPDAKKYLPGADVFLLPSRTEAFPYAILEAGVKGLPIIASGVGGVPEVIKDMQNGILVHSRNPKEIAEAVIYIIEHKKKQKEFGSEIKKTVSNFFSIEKMLKETTNLY